MNVSCEDIRDMVKWSLEHYDEVSTLGDQSVISHYWFHEGRSKITLDYAGELCLTMSDPCCLNYGLIMDGCRKDTAL